MRFLRSESLDQVTTARKDLIWVVIIAAIVLLLAIYFDVLDRFVHWYVTMDEPYEVEEIIPVLLVLPFALAFFAWRRWQELIAEIRTHLRTEDALRQERDKLQKALSEIDTLSGLLPICAACKKVRDDAGYWDQIETYFEKHPSIMLSHSLCPECAVRLYPEYYPQESKGIADDQHQTPEDDG